MRDLKDIINDEHLPETYQDPDVQRYTNLKDTEQAPYRLWQLLFEQAGLVEQQCYEQFPLNPNFSEKDYANSFRGPWPKFNIVNGPWQSTLRVFLKAVYENLKREAVTFMIAPKNDIEKRLGLERLGYLRSLFYTVDLGRVAF